MATRGTTGSTSRSSVLATVCVVVIIALSAAGHSRAAAPSRKDLSSSLINPGGENPATSSALPSTTRNGGDRSGGHTGSKGADAAIASGGGSGTASGLIDTHYTAITARALTATSTSAPTAASASTPTTGPNQAPAAPPTIPTSVTSAASTPAPVAATTTTLQTCAYADIGWSCYEAGDVPCKNSRECEDLVAKRAVENYNLKVGWGCKIDPIFEAACFENWDSMCYQSRCFGFFDSNITAYTDDDCAGCNAVKNLEPGYQNGDYQNAENGSLIAS